DALTTETRSNRLRSRRQGMARSSIAGSLIVLLSLWGDAGALYDDCIDGTVGEIGDGRCNSENNNPLCGFDGGDCCPCTCTDGPLHSCIDNAFDQCQYPDCEQWEEQNFSSGYVECEDDALGDGFCDPEYNVPACNYDGGDCCACSCVDGPLHSCGDSSSSHAKYDGSAVGGADWGVYDTYEFYYTTVGYTSSSERSSCRDPVCLFDPAAFTEFPDCTGDWWTLANGICDAFNNNLACGYDGGDCCRCTCTSQSCAGGNFNCLDPSVNDEEGELYGCEEPPPATPPCSAEAQRAWVVETSTQVQALANAINCTGGDFEVEWIGHVVLHDPLYVANGTTLTVTGADATAVMDGNGTTRLFLVVNATVALSGISLRNGAGLVGGAVAAAGSTLTFAQTAFESNSAAAKGGALYASESSVLLDGVEFSFNDASGGGGAMYLTHKSSVWSAEGTPASFASNRATAGDGGAIFASSSDVSLSGRTEMVANGAFTAGGAVYLTAGSGVSWNGGMLVSNNSCFAGGGGGMFVLNGSFVSWEGDTEFSSNYAFTNGGAIASPATDATSNPETSALVMGGTTTFSNNTCEGNGGAVALLGACSASATATVNFSRNNAKVAGGAVYVSSAGFGPSFTNTSFIMNSAEIGGAVSLWGTGNAKDVEDDMPPYPTTFDHCYFYDNVAGTTGGAIESAAGHDDIFGSVFEGNTAPAGGALRLAGMTAFHNCSLADNFANDGEGAAVSNIGIIWWMDDVSFLDNAFVCPQGMYLDYNASSDPYGAVCHGCPACHNCSFGESTLMPVCADAIEHSTSSGGSTTRETLSIDPGYWRATDSSKDVLACYYADACLGGVTGRDDYCLEGYEGPYCAVCSDGYSPQLGFTCMDCSGSICGIMSLVLLSIAGVLITLAVLTYLMPREGKGGSLGRVERIARYIPLQSFKIIIVSWQILTQFTSVANVAYPDVYQHFLDMLDVFNFELGWALSAGCVVDLDFHDRLLISTVGPMIGVLFLVMTYAAVAFVSRDSPETLKTIWNKHVFMVLLLAFLVYSGVSSVIFKTFACEELADGNVYLRADYRIQCDSLKHQRFEVYAAFMVFVYAVGIPVFFGVLLFRDRDAWGKDGTAREEAARFTSTSDLWKPYKQSAAYYELVECSRRLLLTGVVVFIYPNTSAQITVTLMMAFVFLLISEVLDPFMSRWDTWINRMGHVVVFMSMFAALLLKVDVSDEQASSQRVFEVVLVSVHACMLLVVVVETFFVAFSLRAEHREARALDVSRR
ncbi:unnamed protein product, partial [Scytosiphon promiscuus]